MARVDDEFFDEHAVVAERGFCFRARARKALGNLVARMGDAHAFAAAAGRRLDHDREADLLRDPNRLPLVFDHAEMARHGRDLGLGSGLLALDLVAHGGDRLRIGADEGDTGALERDRKCLTFGQEPIPGMDRLRAGRPTGFDDLVDLQVALGGRRRADGDGFICHFDVQGVSVGVGIDRDGRNAHPARGLDDAARDLAAIGNQNALEHPHSRSTRAPYACVDLGPMSTPDPTCK